MDSGSESSHSYNLPPDFDPIRRKIRDAWHFYNGIPTTKVLAKPLMMKDHTRSLFD
jgi:hypothetical protein